MLSWASDQFVRHLNRTNTSTFVYIFVYMHTQALRYQNIFQIQKGFNKSNFNKILNVLVHKGFTLWRCGSRCLSEGHFMSDQPGFATISYTWPGKGTSTLSSCFLMYKMGYNITHRSCVNTREITYQNVKLMSVPLPTLSQHHANGPKPCKTPMHISNQTR